MSLPFCQISEESPAMNSLCPLPPALALVLACVAVLAVTVWRCAGGGGRG